MLGMFKQQYEAAVGKDDVGISANGLKVFFALSNYYNKYYSEEFDENNFRYSDKTFIKQFKLNGKEYKIGGISDINISDIQKAKMMDILQLDGTSFRNSDAAMFLSGFTSAATDNAKILLMAKVNASVELAAMHIYLMTLGFEPEEIVDIMTSEIVEDVLKNLKDDIFTKNNVNIVPVILQKLKKQYDDEKNPIKLENLDAFTKIYLGAQEITKLARILGVNQKTSANIEEIHKFLTNFETLILARENDLFGSFNNHIKSNLATTYNSDQESKNTISYNKTLNEMIDKIISASSGRFDASDVSKKYIKDILKKASNIQVNYIDYNGDIKQKYVSILGGEFDYRYYIQPGNDNYVKTTKDYYNLIKDTFNVFDIIGSVSHFRGMIDSLIQSHHLLTLSSMKYSGAFNLLKDLVRKFGYNLKNNSNSDIKYLMGNDSFNIKITDKNINGILLYMDSILRKN